MKKPESPLSSWKILNGAQLKWIAMTSMFLDHLNKGVFYILLLTSTNPLLGIVSNTLDILGRFAFPIFLFQLAEGVHYTRNRLRYLLRLLIFGVLAEVPYDMFETGEWWDPTCQNMFFTLALAMVVLWILDELRKKLPSLWFLPGIPVIFGGAFLSALLGLDYTYYGILVPVIFYLLREKRFLSTILSYLAVLKELWSLPGFLILNLYNGERGQISKWIGYWFYPLHLFLIGLFRIYVLKL